MRSRNRRKQGEKRRRMTGRRKSRWVEKRKNTNRNKSDAET